VDQTLDTVFRVLLGYAPQGYFTVERLFGVARQVGRDISTYNKALKHSVDIQHKSSASTFLNPLIFIAVRKIGRNTALLTSISSPRLSHMPWVSFRDDIYCGLAN
jgi:hypothetical protein